MRDVAIYTNTETDLECHCGKRLSVRAKTSGSKGLLKYASVIERYNVKGELDDTRVVQLNNLDELDAVIDGLESIRAELRKMEVSSMQGLLKNRNGEPVS